MFVTIAISLGTAEHILSQLRALADYEEANNDVRILIFDLEKVIEMRKGLEVPA